MSKDLEYVLRFRDVELFGTESFPHRLVEVAEKLNVTIWAAILHVNQNSLRQHTIDWKELWDLEVFAMKSLSTFAVEIAVLATCWQFPRWLVGGELHYAGEEDWDDAESRLA